LTYSYYNGRNRRMMITAKLRDLGAIEADIAHTKEALSQVRGTETEVYARIVGYYRSVRNWNKGKREEYNHRKQFVYEQTPSHKLTGTETVQKAIEQVCEQNQVQSSNGIHYEFFARKTCPNCPPVKEYLENCAVEGSCIDVDTEQGFERARELQILAAPTVVVFDAQGNEIARAHTAQELSVVFEPALELSLA